ncbi:Lrp/AsnC family transcriptional regulator, leucine-responsive regulatory protein [Fodinibius salinus]|uniref:Lrp/AsnC family transcriptional regulator, leucine-responsive regulatory protein n=1 Tax=Fodinibius salinus TaxID=860790 RepID=A0A5D3YIS3_9BACT|nr:Lrp/AsnC family transcriptional regulator [Fodinibius salinus]TYP92635.1 Lrp/AsnC family transcriptional regulator, leucine-responsive regulatory protein [Fodinibius salinus]
MAKGLDEIDIKILKHLQEDGRSQRNKLADIVHLSVPSVSERMRKLEDKELIQEYRAILDSKKFKFDITAFVFVEVDGSDNYSKFVDKACSEPEILECHSITGDGSHILKIRTENTASFEKLLSRLQSWNGVSKSRSNVVLSSFKETTTLPIEKTFDPK